jgi:ribosome recycling factor
MNFDFKAFETKLAATKEWLQKEYSTLRSGRAAPAILDGVQVSAYGSLMPLKQVGSVSIEDARTLRVTAYDAGLLKDIERSIADADLGVGTSSDGVMVRISFPELTTERREQLVKLAKGKLEEARTSVRLARDETWKEIQEKERASELTEDDKFVLKDQMQEKVDKLNEQLEEMFEGKEKEMSA